MNLFHRYLLYLADCLAMLALIGFQIILFQWKWPFDYDTSEWLSILLNQHGTFQLFVSSVMGGTLYWTVVDFHPTLLPHRVGVIVDARTGAVPSLKQRIVRSAVKAATLFGGGVLLLVAVFRDDNLFLHEAVSDTVRRGKR